MQASQYSAVIAAAALLVGLYFGANTIPPKAKQDGKKPITAASNAKLHQEVHAASFDSIITAARQRLPEHARIEVQSVETKLENIGDSMRMIPWMDSLAALWRSHRQPEIAAFYYLKTGELENSVKKLTFAAQSFLEFARKATDASMQQWEAENAIAGFNRAMQLDTQNDTIKINLAETLIGTGETMEGVLMLRDVTTKNPDIVAANLILGQQGIISGQYEKATARFENVIRQEPENVEAMLGMAEVYRNKGDKEKAISFLNQAKKIMNNPEFSKDIDKYIQTIN